MKLKTSFFKRVALKKDILRFAPIWALYFIGMMLIILEMGYYQDYDRYARNFMPGFITAFGIVNLCYAGFCANLLFGDLYNTKLCYSLHAMPYRRESWLITHLVTGLLFSLVPNAIVALYMMFRLEDYWFLSLYWYLAVTLQYIFFYGIATASAMLTGNRFPMLVFYALFNFVAMLLYATVNVIYIPMMEGVIADLEGFSRFSPVVQIFNFEYFTFTRIDETLMGPGGYYTESFYRYDGLADGWGYTAILGAVGVAAMAVSFWLYRKRHLECAGDFIAFPKLKGVVCVILTVCVALCFALVGEMAGGIVLWLAVGLYVGFFGSLMLLERRIKVFRKRTFLGFAAMALVATLSMLSVYLDWFGIEDWTPKADRVASVTVSNNRNEYNGTLKVTLEDTADIAQIIEAHEDCLDYLGKEDENRFSSYTSVYLTYKMNSGRTVRRHYRIPTNSDCYLILRRYLYTSESMLGFTDPAKAAADVNYLYCNKGEIPKGLYEVVLKALMADCDRGLVTTEYSDSSYYIEYSFVNDQGQGVHRSLYFDRNSGELSALLKSPEIAMGFADWEQFLSGIASVSTVEQQIPKSQWEELLTAIYQDIKAGVLEAGEYEKGAFSVYYEMRTPQGEYFYREFYISDNAKNTMTWLTDNGYIPE